MLSYLKILSDKRGHYTRLDGVFRACLRQLNEDEDYNEEGVREDFASYDSPPFKAPLLYFDFVEICGGARGCIKSIPLKVSLTVQNGSARAPYKTHSVRASFLKVTIRKHHFISSMGLQTDDLPSIL